MRFENEQQCNITQETARARKIKFVDESIDTLKLSTLLALVRYILMFIVNIKNKYINVCKNVFKFC